MIGECKLCLKSEAELVRSHILPAALYRLLRDDSSPANPNPWLISNGVEVQTSRQEWANVFCRDCEQRICNCGEKWVFRNGWQKDGTFRLRSNLEVSEPISREPNGATTIYQAGAIRSVDVGALAYFGASIFWRASISNGKSKFEVRLGPYGEEFRKYLAGETAFPSNTVLTVSVRPKAISEGMSQLPRPIRLLGVRGHTFTMPGLSFNLFAGQRMPDLLKPWCIVRGPGNPIVISHRLEASLLQAASKALDAVPLERRLPI